MNEMECQRLDRILEAAVIVSWPDLVANGAPALVHVEYDFGPSGDISFLQVWCSTIRGVWHLVCTYSVTVTHPRKDGLKFANGYASARLTDTLNFVMRHQDKFLVPPNLGRQGLLQITSPSTEELTSTRLLIKESLERIELHSQSFEPDLRNGEMLLMEVNMDERHKRVLELLKRELAFLDSGGYRRSSNFPWRARYIFEESPSCPNSADRTRPHRCIDCWLMEFVVPDLRTEQVPCRFVELGTGGVTVDSLYRCATLSESEKALRHWLYERIREVEREVCETKKLWPD